MKFCSRNYSLIWSNIFIKNSGIYEKDEDDFPRGPLMDHFIKIFFLDEIKNIKKHCRFVWASSAGNYNPLNQSYDGGIGFVAQSKADIFTSANLNTINVIVDISDLLFTKEKVLETKKELCFLDKSSEQNYLLKASKDTIPYRIFEKINKQDQCFLYQSNNLGKYTFEDDLDYLDRKKYIDPTKVFLVVLDFLSSFVSKTAKLVFKKDTFRSDIPLYESVRCFIIKKTLDNKIKEFLNICINVHLKFGFMSKILKDFDILFNSQFFRTNNDELISYIGLRHYIQDNSKIGPLTFKQLDYVFRIYFAIQILILIIGLIHYLIIYLKNLNLIYFIYRIRFWF